MSCRKRAKHQGVRCFERVEPGCESGNEQLLRINLDGGALPGGDLVEQLLFRPLIAANDHQIDSLVTWVMDIETGFLQEVVEGIGFPRSIANGHAFGQFRERTWISSGNEPLEDVVVRNGERTEIGGQCGQLRISRLEAVGQPGKPCDLRLTRGQLPPQASRPGGQGLELLERYLRACDLRLAGIEAACHPCDPLGLGSRLLLRFAQLAFAGGQRALSCSRSFSRRSNASFPAARALLRACKPASFALRLASAILARTVPCSSSADVHAKRPFPFR